MKKSSNYLNKLKILIIFLNGLIWGQKEYNVENLILNGDSFICTNPNYSSYQFIDVQFKVDDEKFSQQFAITDRRDSLEFREKFIGSGLTISKSDFTELFTKKVYGNRGIDVKKFANMLKSKKLMLIRTVDGCGEQVDLRFNMEGFAEAISQLG